MANQNADLTRRRSKWAKILTNSLLAGKRDDLDTDFVDWLGKSIEKNLFEKYDVKRTNNWDSYNAHIKRLWTAMKRNQELRESVLAGLTIPTDLCGKSTDELATREKQQERKRALNEHFKSTILRSGSSIDEGEKTSSEFTSTKEGSRVKQDEKKVPEAGSVVAVADGGEVCRFKDVDGTQVEFRVRDGRTLDGWMDGLIVNRDMKEITIYRDSGIVDDGTDEHITIVNADRSRVYAWFARIKSRIVCSVMYRNTSPMATGEVVTTPTSVENKKEEDDDGDDDDDDDDIPLAELERRRPSPRKTSRKRLRITDEEKRGRTKRGRRRKNSGNEIAWRTYYTEKDNETLQEISNSLGGNPSVQELIDNNFDTHPMITATSPLYPNTPIFLERMGGGDRSRIIEKGDFVFVRWPQYGDIWYECVVGEGEDVPFVVESVPGAEPMFSESFVFWPGGKDMETGAPADHMWAWQIPSPLEEKKSKTNSGVAVSENKLDTEDKATKCDNSGVVSSATSTRKNARKSIAAKKGEKKTILAKTKTKSFVFRVGTVTFYFRDRKLEISDKTMLPTVQDSSVRLKHLSMCGLKLIRKSTSKKMLPLSDAAFKKMMKRLKCFHVIFTRMGDAKCKIGEWKTTRPTELIFLRKSLGWVWKRKEIRRATSVKEEIADVHVRLSLDRTAHSAILEPPRIIDDAVVGTMSSSSSVVRKIGSGGPGHKRRANYVSGASSDSKRNNSSSTSREHSFGANGVERQSVTSSLSKKGKTSPSISLNYECVAPSGVAFRRVRGDRESTVVKPRGPESGETVIAVKVRNGWICVEMEGSRFWLPTHNARGVVVMRPVPPSPTKNDVSHSSTALSPTTVPSKEVLKSYASKINELECKLKDKEETFAQERADRASVVNQLLEVNEKLRKSQSDLEDENAHYKSILDQEAEFSANALSSSYNEKWGALYSNIATLRDALKINIMKRRFWLKVGPGDDSDDDDEGGEAAGAETFTWQMRRSSPPRIAMFLLDRISDVRKFEMLHVFRCTFYEEESAVDEGGVTNEAFTLAMSEKGIPALRLGSRSKSLSLFVRVGTAWLPNPDLKVKFVPPAVVDSNAAREPCNRTIPRLSYAESSTVTEASLALPLDRKLLHRALMSINSAQFWLAGISSTGKPSTICERIAGWPYAMEWGRCRWFEALGRLFAYGIANRIPIPSSLMPDVLIDFLLDIEPKMETKSPISRILKYLVDSGYGWVKVAFHDPKRHLADEIAAADEDLAAQLKEGASDHDAVRLLAQKKLIDSRRSLLVAIKRGFEFLPVLRSLSLFEASERRQLISGVEKLTKESLCDVIRFENFSSTSDTPNHVRAILLAWERDDAARARRSSGNEAPESKLKQFLQFVTGLVAIVQSTAINIACDTQGGSEAKNRMPTAQTCTSSMTIPDYGDMAVLRERLELAIHPQNRMMEDEKA